jgi:hypothetical protein
VFFMELLPQRFNVLLEEVLSVELAEPRGQAVTADGPVREGSMARSRQAEERQTLSAG